MLSLDPSSSSLSLCLASTISRSAFPSTMSTVGVPEPVPSDAEDCERLRKAYRDVEVSECMMLTPAPKSSFSQILRSFGNVLTDMQQISRNLEQLAELVEVNKQLFRSLDSTEHLDVHISQLCWRWQRPLWLSKTLPPDVFDAHLANVAAKSTSTSCLQVFLELACTRSPQQLLMWKQAFHARYKKSPEEVVARHTTGDFRELVLSLVSSYRYGGDEVDMTLAKEEAKILREKILKKAYSDKDLIWILATRSKAQVNATLNHYRNEFGNDINKDLKTDPKDEFLFMLRATVKCLTHPEKYFEKVLRLAIKRRGTDEAALIRVVVTRAEVDMKLITEEYQRKNNIPLHRAIVKDTHGEYEKMLLALVGDADP